MKFVRRIIRRIVDWFLNRKSGKAGSVYVNGVKIVNVTSWKMSSKKKRREFWDEWRGFNGRPVMQIKKLLPLFGRRIDLHKFIDADEPECFHSHPAVAYRVVLWGGYVEEIEKEDGRHFRTVLPFTISRVDPELSHRIDWLLNHKSSWSLWFRGKKTHEVKFGCR